MPFICVLKPVAAFFAFGKVFPLLNSFSRVVGLYNASFLAGVV